MAMKCFMMIMMIMILWVFRLLEIYTSDGITMENDDHTYNVGRDDQCIPIVYVATSFIPTLSLTFFSILKYVNLCCNGLEDVDESLGKFLQISLSVFLVYLGFYFMPYTILAFVNDPIQTAFLYMIGASFILCICLLIYSVCSLCVIMGKENIVTVMRKQYGSISYIFFTLASGFSIAYFLTILIFILIH